MRLCPIASGSSGNCIYVGSEHTHILVDVGISAKRVFSGLDELQVNGGEIDAILITHEHSDHINGLGVFLRKHLVPVYATRKTIEAIFKDSSLGKIPKDMFFDIRANVDFVINDLTIHPFRISHDAVDPVAYRISDSYKSVAVCTDLGFYDNYIVENLTGLHSLVIESNHDENMVLTGPYPYHLKQRILSPHGHLSNTAAGQLLCKILHKDLKTIYLGHLSKENNYPELAFESVRMEINMGDNPFRAEDFHIIVASRDERSPEST